MAVDGIPIVAPDDLLFRLSSALGVSAQQLERGVRRYFADFSSYGNEIYETVESRLAHWLAYLQGDWFQARLDEGLLAARSADVVVDLGFSVPYCYTQVGFRSTAAPAWIFVDRHESARHFYEAIVALNGWHSEAARDTVLMADIESRDESDKVVAAVAAHLPRRLVVIASEVLEHLADDAECWRLIAGLESIASVQSVDVCATLPIGTPIPSHLRSFASVAVALDYFSSRISTESWRVLEPPPGRPRNPFLSACLSVRGRGVKVPS